MGFWQLEFEVLEMSVWTRVFLGGYAVTREQKPCHWKKKLVGNFLESYVLSHILVLMEGLMLSAKSCVGLWIIHELAHQVPSLIFWWKQWVKKKEYGLKFLWVYACFHNINLSFNLEEDLNSKKLCIISYLKLLLGLVLLHLIILEDITY